MQDFAGDFTVLIKLLDRNDALMRRHLEYAVGACIDDQCACFYMLATVVADDIGAGIGLVTEHPASCAALKLRDNLRREAVGIGRHRLF